MNHFRKSILVTSLISLVAVGCSERKSALPAAANAAASVAGGQDSAGTAESKTATEESIPAADQPAP
jgi:hypothetical protein